MSITRRFEQKRVHPYTQSNFRLLTSNASEQILNNIDDEYEKDFQELNEHTSLNDFRLRKRKRY